MLFRSCGEENARDGSFIVATWTTSLWTTDNSELYCNALYVGPILDSVGVRTNRKVIVAICGALGTFLGSIGFYQIFFATFINTLGAIAPPLCAPILADYYMIGKRKYDTRLLEKQPNVRTAGIISFVIGAFLGYMFQYQWSVPFGLPSGLLAMVISFFIYILIYKISGDSKADKKFLFDCSAYDTGRSPHCQGPPPVTSAGCPPTARSCRRQRRSRPGGGSP